MFCFLPLIYDLVKIVRPAAPPSLYPSPWGAVPSDTLSSLSLFISGKLYLCLLLNGGIFVPFFQH